MIPSRSVRQVLEAVTCSLALALAAAAPWLLLESGLFEALDTTMDCLHHLAREIRP